MGTNPDRDLPGAGPGEPIVPMAAVCTTAAALPRPQAGYNPGMSTKESASPAGPHGGFDVNVERYDALIDWDRRLNAETPFYRSRFEQIGAKRVLDAACGTGRHAAMFSSWGLRVEGADISPEMIALCRSRHRDSDRLCWAVRPFTDRPLEQATFDAVVCVGNSLALAEDRATVASAVAAMLEALRPGGMLIIQVLNLWRIPEGRSVLQKCIRHRDQATDRVLIKTVHRVADRGYVGLFDLDLTGEGVQPHLDQPSFWGLTERELLEAATAGRGTDPQCFGSFQEVPYDAESSPDLVFTCRKA